jgi:hypothetical protein
MLLCEIFKNLSADFYKWFDGSKAVDADGNPLKLYHGTSKDKDFKYFNVAKSGVWFTPSPKVRLSTPLPMIAKATNGI